MVLRVIVVLVGLVKTHKLSVVKLNFASAARILPNWHSQSSRNLQNKQKSVWRKAWRAAAKLWNQKSRFKFLRIKPSCQRSRFKCRQFKPSHQTFRFKSPRLKLWNQVPKVSNQSFRFNHQSFKARRQNFRFKSQKFKPRNQSFKPKNQILRERKPQLKH